MQSKSVGDLVHLSAREAVARHFDQANYRVLRWLLLATMPVTVVAGLSLAVTGDSVQATSWIPALGVALWIFFARSSSFFVRYGRQLWMLYLCLLVLASTLSWSEPEPAYAFAGFVFPAVLLFLRLDRTDYIALLGVDLACVAWSLFRDGMPEELVAKGGMAFATFLFGGVVLWIAETVSRRGRASFLEAWRFQVSRERERSRMRSELEDAREIQLSMLPTGAPQLDWVDFSSVSLPASEVGGDYFDYFELSGSRLAVVIGDVAGHGVASGLVLSGVRSSLYLLQEELVRPVEVLRKLDRMLRETVGGRIFTTFQIALLDPVLGRITVANAGHPPLFLASRNGRVVRLGGNSLPLGTRLEGDFVEQSEVLGEGDALLLFSDGVPEVRNLHAEEFGEGRLLDELRRARPGASARLVRDSLLNSLARFKGDVEQEDDLTLVVVRVGNTSSLG